MHEQVTSVHLVENYGRCLQNLIVKYLVFVTKVNLEPEIIITI